jgi:hypothetical protein
MSQLQNVIAICVGTTALVLRGVPAWLIAFALVAWLIVSVTKAVFPQESRERLAWCTDRRRRRGTDHRRPRRRGRQAGGRAGPVRLSVLSPTVTGVPTVKDRPGPVIVLPPNATDNFDKKGQLVQRPLWRPSGLIEPIIHKRCDG